MLRVVNKDVSRENVFEPEIAVYDLDRNNYLSENEAIKALESKQLTGRTAAFLSAYAKYINEIQSLSDDEFFTDNDGITPRDLYKLKQLRSTNLTNTITSHVSESEMIITNRPNDLFGEVNLPSIHAFRQKQLGSCYLLSVIGSLAEVRPDAIRDIFVGSNNGQYTLKFPGGSKEILTIEAPQDGEIASYVHVNRSYGLWPSLIEKAAGMFRKSYYEGDAMHHSVDGGGYSKNVIELLTGHQAKEIPLFQNDTKEIEQRLINSIKQNRAVVLATSDGGKVLSNTDLLGRHAYSITNYNPKTRLFTVVDPNKVVELHGNNGDGIMYLNIKQVNYYFDYATIETALTLEKKKDFI
jgi:hypothetical protein